MTQEGDAAASRNESTLLGGSQKCERHFHDLKCIESLPSTRFISSFVTAGRGTTRLFSDISSFARSRVTKKVQADRVSKDRQKSFAPKKEYFLKTGKRLRLARIASRPDHRKNARDEALLKRDSVIINYVTRLRKQ